MVTVFFQKTVNIRKFQTCWGCLRKFNPGASLLKVECVDDSGDFSRAYWCDTCQKVVIEMDDMDNEFFAGEVRDGDPEYWESVRAGIEDAL
jgi:hypothetical protein